MKKSVMIICAMTLISFFLAGAAMAADMGKTRTATGKVTSVDPQGTALTITTGAGKAMMDVGVIVDKDTAIMVKGKKAALDAIKVGDRVTITYAVTDNLYAKRIVKK
jgi:hypothetical protein